MGLLDWFRSRTSRFTRFDDAYALTRPALWRSLQKTVQSPLHSNKSIWLVMHFTDTFIRLQEELDTWQVDYEIVTSRIDPNHLDRSGLLATDQVKVVLAEMLTDPGSQVWLEPNLDSTIAMIVVERHPQLKYDDQVESFARNLPARVEFGYYLSLDDEVIRLVINETSIKILQQLGMNEHELIASMMVTRRLNTMLKRFADNYRSDEPADSAQQWLELNGAQRKP